MDSLNQWDSMKLSQLLDFIRSSEGYPVSLKTLRQKLENFVKHLVEECGAIS